MSSPHGKIRKASIPQNAESPYAKAAKKKIEERNILMVHNVQLYRLPTHFGAKKAKKNADGSITPAPPPPESTTWEPLNVCHLQMVRKQDVCYVRCYEKIEHDGDDEKVDDEAEPSSREPFQVVYSENRPLGITFQKTKGQDFVTLIRVIPNGQTHEKGLLKVHDSITHINGERIAKIIAVDEVVKKMSNRPLQFTCYKGFPPEFLEEEKKKKKGEQHAKSMLEMIASCPIRLKGSSRQEMLQSVRKFICQSPDSPSHYVLRFEKQVPYEAGKVAQKGFRLVARVGISFDAQSGDNDDFQQALKSFLEDVVPEDLTIKAGEKIKVNLDGAIDTPATLSPVAARKGSRAMSAGSINFGDSIFALEPPPRASSTSNAGDSAFSEDLIQL